MAKVNTNRPEAAEYRGRDLKFVREVGPGEPSFDERMHQVILSDGGTEVQFYANEVELNDDEKQASAKTKKKAEASRKEADEAARKNIEGKNAMLKQTAAGSKVEEQPRKTDADKPEGITGGVAYGTPAMEGHESRKDVVAETSPFNRVPGEPQRHAADEGATSRTGPSGYPEGSGPDPQGRREDAKDQSKNDPRERPAPRG